MSQDVRVYDLGKTSAESVLGPDPTPTIPELRPPFATVQQPISPRPVRSPNEGIGPDALRSLSLFLPGVSQIVRGQVSLGLFYLSSLAFLGSLTWAILNTLDRISPTLELLGLSMYVVFWTLVWVYLMLITVHLSGVWTATEGARPRARHPALSATASLIVPGWGQILNGDRLRALLFLGGLWIAAGFWIAASAPVTELLNAHMPVVTSVEQMARMPMVLWTARWTAPLLICSLAVYDAAASAVDHRRQGLD